MIRIVCPGCHSPLSSAELEQVTIDGHLSLVCPECSMVLLTEPLDENLTLQPVEVPLHA